ncbi:MAG: hypothetical protein AWU57_3630 [Marinobacter sp. T13-3]|nr:MAG: hypothetical protein AWU57_3630 [Marinobacter sp. T13-3]
MRVVFIVFFSLLSSLSIAGNIGEISGLFGYEFGEKIDNDSKGIIQCANNNITCWGNNRDLTPAKYNVQLNINKNKEIFRIFATQTINKEDSLEECLSRANGLQKKFSRIYGISFNSEEKKDTMRTSFTWQDVDIETSTVKLAISCERYSMPGMTDADYILGISVSNTDFIGASKY